MCCDIVVVIMHINKITKKEKNKHKNKMSSVSFNHCMCLNKTRGVDSFLSIYAYHNIQYLL